MTRNILLLVLGISLLIFSVGFIVTGRANYVGKKHSLMPTERYDMAGNEARILGAIGVVGSSVVIGLSIWGICTGQNPFKGRNKRNPWD